MGQATKQQQPAGNGYRTPRPSELLPQIVSLYRQESLGSERDTYSEGSGFRYPVNYNNADSSRQRHFGGTRRHMVTVTQHALCALSSCWTPVSDSSQ